MRILFSKSHPNPFSELHLEFPTPHPVQTKQPVNVRGISIARLVIKSTPHPVYIAAHCIQDDPGRQLVYYSRAIYAASGRRRRPSARPRRPVTFL
ncbi:hypothetical protein EVAR_54482_1 [Eumeta japonica]|uniref:Uncharacterized protein n=1 Tax=Eumeta variegata TaxID=151549 RepID=A0A4C1YW20_EUMVA|nr:hypothetical protein EVAR_54482_1 [Eumeta japonica]